MPPSPSDSKSRARVAFVLALVLVAVVGIALFSLIVPDPAPRVETPPPPSPIAANPGATRASPPPAVTMRPPARPDTLPAPSELAAESSSRIPPIVGTPLQRRLRAGEHLREVRRRFDQAWGESFGSGDALSDASTLEMLRWAASLDDETVSAHVDRFLTISEDLVVLSEHGLFLEFVHKAKIFRQEASLPNPASSWAKWLSGIVMVAMQLTTPPVDFRSVKLHNPVEGDRFGNRVDVRVWRTQAVHPSEAPSADELASAARMLSRLRELSSRPLKDGFDVLVAPALATDVFPRNPRLPWAAGLYVKRDRFVIVSWVHPPYRGHVLRHELAHAFLRQFTEAFSNSRFVNEGLAEYLAVFAAVADRGDADGNADGNGNGNGNEAETGLSVPPETFADNFAALVGYIEQIRATADSCEFRFDGLLKLSPSEFYALRHFGYRVAEASMVYIEAESGGGVIESSIRELTDAPIVAALERIEWSAFERFVRRHARAGDPSRATMLLEADEPETRDSFSAGDLSLRSPRPEDALREIGASVQPGTFDWDALPPASVSDDEAHVAGVLDAMRGGETFLLTDLSWDMNATLAPGIADSRLDVVDSLLDTIAEAAGHEIDVVARLGERIAEIDDLRRPDGVEFTATTLASWLDRKRRASGGQRMPNLVICVAGRDRAAREAAARGAGGRGPVTPDQVSDDRLARHYTSLIEKGMSEGSIFDPRAVLVVDLGLDTDARALARGIAGALSLRGRVAVWAPASRGE